MKIYYHDNFGELLRKFKKIDYIKIFFNFLVKETYPLVYSSQGGYIFELFVNYILSFKNSIYSLILIMLITIKY